MAGRPRGAWADKPWRDAIRKAVNERHDDGGKKLTALARKCVEEGLAGDLTAMQEIGNRLDGKAHQTSDVTVRDDRMVVEAPPPAKDADDWASKYGPH